MSTRPYPNSPSLLTLAGRFRWWLESRAWAPTTRPAEIRDNQREGLALQKDAVERQRQVFALNRWVVIGGAVIVAGLLVVLLVVVAFVVLMVMHLPSH